MIKQAEGFEIYSNVNRKALDLYEKMYDKKLEGIPGFEKWTGISKAVGAGPGIYYNTIHSVAQLVFTLAMSGHRLIDKKLGEWLVAEELTDKKVLSKLKILEICCGKIPTYARCCRAMGADLWTIDKDPDIDYYLEEEEKRKHLCLDFMKQESIEKILDATDGNFDLVTSSFLSKEAKEFALPLLKIGGLYYWALEPYLRVFEANKKLDNITTPLPQFL